MDLERALRLMCYAVMSAGGALMCREMRTETEVMLVSIIAFMLQIVEIPHS